MRPKVKMVRIETLPLCAAEGERTAKIPEMKSRILDPAFGMKA